MRRGCQDLRTNTCYRRSPLICAPRGVPTAEARAGPHPGTDTRAPHRPGHGERTHPVKALCLAERCAVSPGAGYRLRDERLRRLDRSPQEELFGVEGWDGPGLAPPTDPTRHPDLRRRLAAQEIGGVVRGGEGGYDVGLAPLGAWCPGRGGLALRAGSSASVIVDGEVGAGVAAPARAWAEVSASSGPVSACRAEPVRGRPGRR